MDGCTDVCNDVGFSSTSKSKPSLSNENAMTDFRQTWYVGSGGHKYYPRGLSSPNANVTRYSKRYLKSDPLESDLQPFEVNQ